MALPWSGQSAGQHSVLLRAPLEIRLRIYECLLSDFGNKSLIIASVRTSNHQESKRSKFHYIYDRLHPHSIESTYAFFPGHEQRMHPAILCANQQIHAEAAHFLYSSHTFSFGEDIECIVPFFTDLNPTDLASVRHISFTKRALPYTWELDRYVWRNACAFLSSRLKLSSLDLNVVGGVPTRTGHADAAQLLRSKSLTYTKSDFVWIVASQDMEWARQLSAIKNLSKVNVRALLGHCPHPSSHAKAFFIIFSASIEIGFAQFLRSLMEAATAPITASTQGARGPLV